MLPSAAVWVLQQHTNTVSSREGSQLLLIRLYMLHQGFPVLDTYLTLAGICFCSTVLNVAHRLECTS